MRRYVYSVAILFFIPIIAENSKGFRGKPRIPRSRDIRKFLNTSEPIWTYNSTLEETLRCQVDVMSKCSLYSIQYKRSYDINKQVRTEHLEGWFLKHRRDEMFVAVVGNVPVIAEKLVYASEDASCGVFMVMLPFPGEERWYDLRVKNSSILTGPRMDCSKYFTESPNKGTKNTPLTKGGNSKATANPIYEPQCQRILRPILVPQRPSVKDEHF